MQVIVDIAIIAIAVIVVAVGLYVIPVLKQALETFKQVQQTAFTVEQTVKSLDKELEPILHQARETLHDVSEITTSMKLQLGKLEDSIDNCRVLIDRGYKLSEAVYEQVEQPIFKTLNNINALRSGFKMFFNAFISNKKE